MLTKTEKSFALIFIVLLIAELICGSLENLQTLHYATKPALLVALIVFFLKQSKHLQNTIRAWVLLALVFSLLGDILLMFVDSSPHYFTAGLLAFLVAHIMYIVVFYKNRNTSKTVWGFITLLAIYSLTLFYILKDNLGEMLIPVLIHMLAILSMATMAFLRRGAVPSNSFLLVFLGAILFMVSDSILALNKFYEPLPFSNLSIMFTYGLSQLFIVLGLLKQR